MKAYNKLILLILTIVSFALTGCASVPKGSEKLQQQAESLSPPSGMAGVYYFRPYFVGGSALLELVKLDSQLFGYVGPNSYLYGVVTPGEHSFEAGGVYQGQGPLSPPPSYTPEFRGTTFTNKFTAEEGKNYYFTYAPWKLEIMEVEETDARNWINKLTLSGYNVFENTLSSTSASGEKDCGKGRRFICLTRTSSWHKEGGKVTTKGWLEGKEEVDEHTFLLNENDELKIVSADGEIIILGGRVMLAKDVQLEKGYEIDWADAPMSNYLITTGLLNLAFPNGPSGIVSEHTKEISEQEKEVRVSTGSALFGFKAPWQASVRAVRLNDDTIAYETRLTLEGVVMNIAGVWENMNSSLVLEDSMDISGWETFAIGVFTRQPGRLDPPGGGIILDFGAYPHDFGVDTIGGLRTYIKQQK
jgi:hypothetical protein